MEEEKVVEIACDERRNIEKRGREDDRDDTSLVHLDRDIGRSTAIRAATDLTLGVLDRDTALRLLDEDDECHDEKTDADHCEEWEPTIGLADRPELSWEGCCDRGEDQDRHTVTDTAICDQLTEPHHDRSTCDHDDNHDKEDVPALVRDDVLVATLDQSTWSTSNRDKTSRLQECMSACPDM